MSLPISDMARLVPLAALALLAACSAESDTGQPASPAEAARSAANDGLLDCALDGAAEFERRCELERIETSDGKELVFRHPDGGFRRFSIVTDGRGLVTADGADEATVSAAGDGLIIVEVNEDRYRLPATFRKPGVPGDAAE